MVGRDRALQASSASLFLSFSLLIVYIPSLSCPSRSLLPSSPSCPYLTDLLLHSIVHVLSPPHQPHICPSISTPSPSSSPSLPSPPSLPPSPAYIPRVTITLGICELAVLSSALSGKRTGRPRSRTFSRNSFPYLLGCLCLSLKCYLSVLFFINTSGAQTSTGEQRFTTAEPTEGDAGSPHEQ